MNNAIIEVFDAGVKINADMVEEGTFISAVELSAALKLDRYMPAYGRALERLGKQLEVDLEKKGSPAIVCNKEGGLFVMSSEQAAEYTVRWFHNRLRQAWKLHDRMGRVAAAASWDQAQRDRFDRQSTARDRMVDSYKDDLLESERIEAALEVKPAKPAKLTKPVKP